MTASSPDPFQAELLTSEAKNILVLGGRQTGKSTAAAVRVVYEAAFHPGQTVLLAGPTGRQSGQIMEKARQLARKLNLTLAGPPPGCDGFQLPNGSRVISLPDSESTIRGFSAPRLIVVDDYAAPKCPGVTLAVAEYIEAEPAVEVWTMGTEQAILRELEAFILELGSDFAFVARQKRITVDSEDYYLDLLFYHRRLRRLVAIDLKLGDFKAEYKGQMELYLRWLAKHEQEPGEAPPLGIILCSGHKKREQIELLELDASGIHVAEYLTALPAKEVLQAKLHQAIAQSRARLDNRSGDEA